MRTESAVPPDRLRARLEQAGFFLDDSVLSGLALYLGLLVKWNKAMNLVGTSGWEETLDTLVMDSFHLDAFLRAINLPPDPVTRDLGAGAGLPGIPLRLVWTAGTYTLVEAREKRALFMRTALSALRLPGTAVYHGRAETFFATAERADLIVSRAFMPWNTMLDFVANALAPDGRIVFLTRSPAPGTIPSPWRLVAETAYAVNTSRRHLWCFQRARQ